MRTKNQYYKSRYMIGIYNTKIDDDSLVALCDNHREFAEFLNITENNAKVILSHFFNGKNKLFRYEGRMCEIVFIDIVNLE